MKPRFLFVGEKRSAKAEQMNVRWKDGRLAARQLFDALDTAKVSPDECDFTNWFEDGGPACVRRLAKRGIPIVGMGQKVQAALDAAGISHAKLVHPAARGAIRKKHRYAAHVRSVLAEVTSAA